MRQIEVERKTVDEAIQDGLRELGLSLEEVRIDVLEEGNKGLFGLIGARQAKVRLTVRGEEAAEAESRPAQQQRTPSASAPRAAQTRPEPRRVERAEQPPAPPARQPRPPQRAESPKADGQMPIVERPKAEAPRRQQPEGAPREPRRGRQREDEARGPLLPGEADRACAFLSEVAAKMGVEISAQPSEKEGMLHIDIQGDEKGILIGHRGETLDALQYLVGLVHNKDRQQYRRVQLDSQNYRQKREDTLIRLANRLADKATRSRRRVALEPMNPYERRIMHSALQNNPNVTTHSEGEEPNRRVVILPK